MPPRKKPHPGTCEATSNTTGEAAGVACVPIEPARRRSLRLLWQGEERGGAGPAGGVSETPRRRSARLLSQREGRGDAGPAGAAAVAVPLRRSARLLSPGVERGGAGSAGGAPATPRSRSPRLVLLRGKCGGPTPPPRSGMRKGEKSDRGASLSSSKSRREPPKMSLDSMGTALSGNNRRANADLRRTRSVSSVCEGLRRSPRLLKLPADSGGGVYLDVSGGSDSEGDWKRRPARLRRSIGKGSTVDVGKKDVLGVPMLRADLGRKCGGDVPSVSVAESLGRGDVGNVASEHPEDDVKEVEGEKKREISVSSVTEGGRDKRRRQIVERQEELFAERRCVEPGSGSPGWTSEQEVALHRAYILARPSPHFWKKVAKMVPGKSAQECFDRMHSKVATPAPMQPRSRARPADFSPLGFCDFFNENAKRPKNIKNNMLAHKTVRHILRKHSDMDQGQEADLFSVLEHSPNLCAELSQIEMLPEHIAESPQLFQRSSENFSSGSKKTLSRFKSQVQANFASPEVLKPVKNIALHEKYIDRLLCRKARRRMCAKAACSISSADDEENAVLKSDAVKAAKNVLISEARGIIFQFGRMQSTPSGDCSDDIDGSEDDIDGSEDDS